MVSPYALNGRRVLITGCCGSVGSALVSRLLTAKEYEGTEVVGLDNSEDGIFQMEMQWEGSGRARFLVGDVRDVEALRRAMTEVQVVLHCAALKHVYQCEKAPFEAVKTNILGVEAVIAAARDAGVERVLFTSSDKAVNPTNVMGTSKLMGERLITAANAIMGSRTVFASTRFGNVLGSRGSVVEVFRRQIEAGQRLTLTSKEMTRFVMSINQAVDLVLGSVELARGGEVFITKMPTISIYDLALTMIEALCDGNGQARETLQPEEIGPRPGEKMYEELLTSEEARRAIELRDYFIVMPAFRPVYSGIRYEYPGVLSSKVDRPYVSAEEPLLGKADIRQLLEFSGCLYADQNGD